MSDAGMQPSADYIAFCGVPPIPAEIWQRWINDPVLLAVLAAVPLLTWHVSRRWLLQQRLLFIAGWTVLSLALISPLCALSVALFSMRATQHMVLLMVAAPLLALARPEHLLGKRALAAWQRLQRRNSFAGLCALLFALMLWGWHLPPLYDATFRSDPAYWAMHVTLTGSALLLWMQLLQEHSRRLLAQAAVAFGSFVQMGVLGALLTFSPALLYGAHVTSTLAWGMEPLADQQLGGLIMWVPGCAVLLVAALVAAARALLPPPALAPQPYEVEDLSATPTEATLRRSPGSQP